MNKIRVHLMPRVGVYGQDDEGNPWTTFTVRAWRDERQLPRCVACGQPIERGYKRGDILSKEYFCVGHVELVEDAQ